jgi:hypothetical protein
MGPALPVDQLADDLEWAQYNCQVTLPMALNGPSIPHSGYYRRPQMGPVLQVEHLADDLQRAQQCSQW